MDVVAVSQASERCYRQVFVFLKNTLAQSTRNPQSAADSNFDIKKNINKEVLKGCPLFLSPHSPPYA